MILFNVHIVGRDGIQHVKTVDGRIDIIAANRTFIQNKDGLTIEFENAIAFPGLINSHDHLEFNLFPKISNRIYKNYMEWGPDIHTHNKDIIHSILKIPKQLRFEWGIYKNLLSGVTTVVQHGENFAIKNPWINTDQNCYSLHSVGTEKNWKYKLNKPFIKDKPFIIHIGEGTDMKAFEEINKLLKWNLLKRKLIAIHGVAMNVQQAKSFEALIWCPDSNFFLLNATVNVSELKKATKILFGTDSTLSANWNIWEQIRLARKTNMLTDKELFDSLTSLPALVWDLNDRGIVEESKAADLVIAGMKNENDLQNSFFELNPQDILMVLREGEIILFDEILYAQLNKNINANGFSKIFINNVCKYVLGDLVGLIKEIRKYSADVKFPVEIEQN